MFLLFTASTLVRGLQWNQLDPLSYDDVFEEIKAQFDLLDREISPQCQIDYDKFKSHLLNDSLLLAGFDSPGQWARKSKL